MDDLRQRIAKLPPEKRRQFEKLLQEKARFASGDDRLYKQAIGMLSEAMERENMNILYYRARATADSKDDSLVEALSSNQERMQNLRESLQTYSRNQEKHIQKLRELETIRGRFTRERYDDIHSSFANKALLLAVLNQFLQGVANSDELWETIQRERRYRRVKADPDFGSGGLRRSPWPGPFPGPGRRGSGSWGGPSRGGGDFRCGALEWFPEEGACVLGSST